MSSADLSQPRARPRNPFKRRRHEGAGEDRPGRARRLLSAALAAGALVPLYHTHSDGEVSNGNLSFPMGSWARDELPLVLAVIALLGAAAFLWVARRRAVVAFASLLAAATAAAALALVLGGPPTAARVTLATYISVALGTRQEAVRARLGEPLAPGSASWRGSTIPCLVYAATGPDTAGKSFSYPSSAPPPQGWGASDFLFCFDGGRLVAKPTV